LADKGTSTRIENVAAPPPGRSRWYAGYFLLAVFNIVTISAGMLLNYQLVRQYEEANQINYYWSRICIP
jgi:hypothetical protein